jgi:hypothetical protein
MVSDTEAASAELPPGDPHSLYWSQVLTGAWTCLGWAELEAKQLDVAETYLRSAWALSQGATSGYQLARLLEAKGNKSEAAHLYELASITGVDPPLAGTLGSRSDLTLHIAESYKHLTGKELTATPYKKNGFYDGGLRSELDKQIEVHPIVKATKLTGSAYFMAAFEAGKPTKVQLIAGDKSLASLVPTLQAHVFPPVLPPGSKARLMREIRVICTPWAGCDADLLLPTSIQTSFPTVVNVTKPGDSSAGPKLVPMQPQH